MQRLSERIAELLPYLRRHARALTGSQQAGDAYVAATLEAIISAPDEFPSVDVRIGLYRTFHTIWSSTILPEKGDTSDDPTEAIADRRLAQLTPPNRQALLLTVVEGFTNQEAAVVLGVTLSAVVELVNQAVRDIDKQTATTVLIIEDEPLIAMDLEQIVGSLGHHVLEVAPTRDAAVRTALIHRPGLVLADIQLADGSSGIDAVRDILGDFRVPVIFITAFPERLLEGRRPEPTFLITKPFSPDQVKAAVSQALFFECAAHLIEAGGSRPSALY
ncbi:MAG: response regulator [Defluviicoccus sp.]|nr:MAG: response regulator [Defluviicoccus sp.]